MSISNHNESFQKAVLRHPFFKGMERSTALSLLIQCKEIGYTANHSIIQSFEDRLGLYLVVKGEVEVVVPKEGEGKEEVLEIISQGGILGLSSLYSFLQEGERSKGLYSSVEVRAKMDGLLCLVPYKSLEDYWEETYIKNFLLNETSKRLQDVYYSLSKQVKETTGIEERATILKRVNDVMVQKVITVESSESLHEAASKMGKNRVSSVIVIENEQIVGILTERDLVTRCLAGDTPLSQPVKQGMTPNPTFIHQQAYLYEALTTMIDHSIKHLPVTDTKKRDGPVGIITMQDIMKASHTGALTNARKIEDQQFPLEKIKPILEGMLASLWNGQAPVLNILDIMSGLIDRLYRRVLKQAELELEQEGEIAPCSFAFYVMGSAGREEQFMLTDQDHFLVYETQDEKAVNYFYNLSEKVVKGLAKAGLRLCDGGMMSNQQNWRGGLNRWEERVREWSIHSSEETLLTAQNFFSYRFLYGDESVHRTFQQNTEKQLKNAKILMLRLAQVEKTKPVPVLHSSIRSLLGMDRKSISIKKEILFPFHHALQILSLSHGHVTGSTLTKIRFLKEKGSISSEFEEVLLEAFQEMMKLYMELKRKKQGDQIHLSSLSTQKKEVLYKSVKTIREFQQMMLSHYSLN
ncbi:DUF294 nucleotidyltransferase-like domain-containing protein [Rossellomorea aquimaris]|uniref:DUF294 nucleotidyltransferase-like domain-containing protein n=1 Tax=Rossellomorea aquimaris TaxID=189382 RepID=UPI0007D05221|nr:DUF294 nucleotidyltransferase-like domain-containing protein [Rossellomorea aquimaris]